MKTAILASIFATANASDDWDYFKHGADWEDACTKGATNQSPINLITPDNELFDYPVISGVKDE